MPDPLFVVTGATGHIGTGICERLLADGQRVRAIARTARRLQELADDGAEPAAGSLDDAAFLGRALHGASALFAMIPPNLGAPDFRGYARSIVSALVRTVPASGIRRVVSLSSIGGHRPEGNGPIAALHELETALDRLAGVRVVHLRPAFFLENLYTMLPMIDQNGFIGSPLRPDLALPMIATRDIAAVAAHRLRTHELPERSVVELLGAADYTMADAARAIGRAIGRQDLRYVQFPYADARQAMLGMGMSVSVADGFIEMYRGFNEGRITPTAPRTPDTTTPTTLEQFAADLARAYHAGHAPVDG
jgi:uncharacterized protein YbjT (DUF2867 family)